MGGRSSLRYWSKTELGGGGTIGLGADKGGGGAPPARVSRRAGRGRGREDGPATGARAGEDGDEEDGQSGRHSAERSSRASESTLNGKQG